MAATLTTDLYSAAPGSRADAATGRTDAESARDGATASPSRDVVDWLQTLRAGVVLLLLLSVITGIIYPLSVTVIAAVAFPQKSTGGLIHEGSQLIGSEPVGQPFDDPRYFWGRPSATAPSACNGLAGSGSNLAATNPALLNAVRERVAKLRDADPTNRGLIPVDLVTASASGLDPHISPAAALFQAQRIARVRRIPLDDVKRLIARNTAEPTLGFLGQPRVHVLRLNRSLDAAK